MHDEIIKIGDKLNLEDEKLLEELLVIQNNIEYLENKKTYLKDKASKLNIEIESNKNAIASTKGLIIVIVFIMFILSTFSSVLINISALGHILISILPPALTYGITELYVYLQKVLIKQNEEAKDKYELSLSFIEKDLEREKEKLKTKVIFRKPSFKLIKVDTKELYDYKKRYDALINMDVAEEKPKIKKHEYRH